MPKFPVQFVCSSFSSKAQNLSKFANSGTGLSDTNNCGINHRKKTDRYIPSFQVQYFAFSHHARDSLVFDLFMNIS